MRLQFNFAKKKKIGLFKYKNFKSLANWFSLYTFRVTTIFKGISVSSLKIILLIFYIRIVETCTFVLQQN